MNANFQRVIVVGNSGSGKTTFARHLSQILGYPHIELDALRWGPNWVKKSNDEFEPLVESAASGKCWVVDGSYAPASIWLQATSVVWLNYAFPLTFTRVLIRVIRRMLTQEVVHASNRVSLRRALGILWWVIRTSRRHRLTIEELRETKSFPHLEWVELKKPAEAEKFLQSLTSAK